MVKKVPYFYIEDYLMSFSDLLIKIESLQKELNVLGPLMPELQEKLNKKFRLEFNYNSNHIEGNTLTYGETELYLIFDKTTGEHDGREYDEMRGSDVALKLVQELAADKEHPLTEAFIKNLNKFILVRPYWANAITLDGQPTQRLIETGDYKKFPNSVRLQNGELFNYASPQETPALMSDLLQWYRDESEKKELHPVALAALLHYRFVRIHPFDDGNGRISRLLMNYVLYHNNLPPVIIKSVNKKEYLSALNKADSGDIDSFVSYVANQMIWSLELSITAAKGEEIEEHDDVEKEVALWKKELQSKNPITALPKSDASLKKLYFDILSPFIELFESKIHDLFNDLFNRWEVHSKVNNSFSNEGRKHIDLKVSGKLEPPEAEFSFDIYDVYSIALDIYMSDFNKNLKNHFNVNIKLEILLNNNNYEIKVHTPHGVKSYPDGGRIYNSLPTEKELRNIANDTEKYIFTYIKEHSEIQV